MSLFTLSGNKLAATVLAAGALVVGGTGVAAVADSLQDSPTVTATESPSPSPTATETESPEASPTATETESPEPSPTATETESPKPSPSPADTEEPAPSHTAAGPDATGPAAFGLCNAYTHGGLGSGSTAYAALVTAAGGESHIVTYCADVPAPHDNADDKSAGTSTDQDAEEQGDVQVKQQRQDAAPASEGGAGHQSGNSHAKSGGRR